MNVLGSDPAQRIPSGYDHDWFPWSPLPARRPRRWPNGAAVAVSVVLQVGSVEWERPDHTFLVPPPGGRGTAPYPDFPRMSDREFGHRVGIFRLLHMLRDEGIAPAAVVDVLTVEHYPGLLDHLRPAVAEFIAGGLSASRPITSAMGADEEAHYIGETMDRLTTGLGSRPVGWLGPEHSESTRTPRLLRDAGLGYTMDWSNDEQPYPMHGGGDGLWAFPLSWELSDVSAMYVRQVPAPAYAASIREALAVLRADGRTSGRVIGLHLSPWLSGQAFRARAVRTALAALREDPAVWLAGPGEIVDWCRRG